jgi:protein SFI1
MESRDEVVYYGKLLKLNTVRGKTWEEKWAAVRALQVQPQPQPQPGPSTMRPSRPSADPMPIPAPMSRAPHTTSAMYPTRRDPDTFTLHSHEDEDDDDDDDEEEDIDDSQDTYTPRPPQRQRQQQRHPPPPQPQQPTRHYPPPRRPLSPASELSNSLGLSTHALDVPFPSRARSGTIYASASTHKPPPRLWESISVASDSDEHTGTLGYTNNDVNATSASGYRRNPPIPPRQRLTSDPKPPPASNLANGKPLVVAPTASHRAVAQARESRTNTVPATDASDAWNKIKHARDEEDAALFYRDRLLERCWAVWRENLEWVKVCFFLFLSSKTAAIGDADMVMVNVTDMLYNMCNIYFISISIICICTCICIVVI